MDIAVLGIDLGKTVCSLAGVDGPGALVVRRRIQRFRLLEFLAQLPPCVIAMEACGGAHHVGRFCLQFGHEPRLMSPQGFPNRPYRTTLLSMVPASRRLSFAFSSLSCFSRLASDRFIPPNLDLSC